MQSGTCGKNLIWAFDDGTLKICGEGEMENFSDDRKAPWDKFKFNSIKKIIVEDGATSIGDEAFSRCYLLTCVVISNSVVSLGDGAFSFCFDLISITIPDKVQFIGSRAFQRCAKLKSLEIPASVKKIGYWAFEGCSGLTKIKIPANVTGIGWQVFKGCTNLEEIFYKPGFGFEESLSQGNHAELIPY